MLRGSQKRRKKKDYIDSGLLLGNYSSVIPHERLGFVGAQRFHRDAIKHERLSLFQKRV